MPLPSDLICARIVIQRGCASEERVRECLELQAKNRAVGYDESLHAVLLKRGFLSEEDAKTIERDLALAQFVRGERIFARVCVERGFISQDLAKEILQKQKEDGYRHRIGDMLVQRGMVDRAKRDAIAAEQVKRIEEEDSIARKAEIENKPQSAPSPSHGTPLGEDTVAHQGSFRGVDAALSSFKRDQRRYSSTDLNVPAAIKEGIAIEGYELTDRLGQGSVGVVWKARPKLGGPLVALKVLSPSLTGNPDLLSKFHKAFERASAIDHPALVRLGQVARSGELTYFTMEYVEGESLADRVERGGPLAADRARDLGCEVARALAHVHGQRVLHGGIRPRNVLIARDWRIRLTDLIIGRLAPRLASGDTDDARLYLSPEELTGAAGADPRDDIYSYGLVLYYALVGRHAFPDAQPTPRLEGAPDPRDADPAADPGLSAIVVRATQPSRNDRYRDGNELLQEIDPDRGSDRLPRAPLTPPAPPQEIETPSMLARAEQTMQMAPEEAPAAVERTMAVAPPRGARISPEESGPPKRTLVMPAGQSPPAPSMASAAVPAPAPPKDESFASGKPPARPPLTGRLRRRSLAQPSDAEAQDLTGKVVNNRYRIVSKLGEGGMGVVYRAEHTVMSKAIAFKVLHPSLVKSQESMARFQREVLAMAQFAHRNVVRIYDAGKTEDGRFYIAMEFVEGRDLANVLEKEGALPTPRAVNVLRQVLRAIAEGHAKGIVHRDLKPENILLTGRGSGAGTVAPGSPPDEVVKVMDF
ncbi:protein kinase, partial [bacterium]|nr:protein kinase [bacterium]